MTQRTRRDRSSLAAAFMCFALLGPAASGDTFRDAARSYTLDLPYGWVEVDPAVVRDWDAQSAAAEPSRNYEFRAAFGRAGDATGMPRVLLSFTWSRGLGTASHAEIAQALELRPVARQEIGDGESWADVVASMGGGDAILDMSRDRIMRTALIEHPTLGPLRSWTVGRLARNGVIELTFYAKDAEFDRWSRDFGHMAETLMIDPGVEYIGLPRAMATELLETPTRAERASGGRTFHQKELGCGVEIPSGWHRISDDIIDSMNRWMGERHPNREWRYTDAFTSADEPRALPRVMFQFTPLDLDGLTFKEIARERGWVIVDARSVGGRRALLDRLEHVHVNGAVLDRSSGRVITGIAFNDVKLGPVRSWSIGWLSKRGLVQLHCYALAGDFEGMREEVFAPIVRSFRFDNGVAFEEAAPATAASSATAGLGVFVVGGLFMPLLAMLGVRLILHHAEKREPLRADGASWRERRRARRRAIEAELWPGMTGVGE